MFSRGFKDIKKKQLYSRSFQALKINFKIQGDSRKSRTPGNPVWSSDIADGATTAEKAIDCLEEYCIQSARSVSFFEVQQGLKFISDEFQEYFAYNNIVPTL